MFETQPLANVAGGAVGWAVPTVVGSVAASLAPCALGFLGPLGALIGLGFAADSFCDWAFGASLWRAFTGKSFGQWLFPALEQPGPGATGFSMRSPTASPVPIQPYGRQPLAAPAG